MPPTSSMNTAHIALAFALAATASGQALQMSAEHALLAQHAGVWDATVVYVDQKTGEPTQAKGTSVRRQPLGSSWLIDNFQASLKRAPFRGMATTGYDPIKKKLVGTWIDSMTASLTILEGGWDKDRKVMTMSGARRDPQGRAVTTRVVTSIISKDKHVSEVFTQAQGGKERKTMTVTFTRRSRPMDKVRKL
ncbi:MAG: hypothetical protein CMJ88_13690 [Planctomycetes bacterium]|nr:hypothetical protein [Planctomycetota bacterium]